MVFQERPGEAPVLHFPLVHCVKRNTLVSFLPVTRGKRAALSSFLQFEYPFFQFHTSLFKFVHIRKTFLHMEKRIPRAKKP